MSIQWSIGILVRVDRRDELREAAYLTIVSGNSPKGILHLLPIGSMGTRVKLDTSVSLFGFGKVDFRTVIDLQERAESVKPPGIALKVAIRAVIAAVCLKHRISLTANPGFVSTLNTLWCLVVELKMKNMKWIPPSNNLQKCFSHLSPSLHQLRTVPEP